VEQLKIIAKPVPEILSFSDFLLVAFETPKLQSAEMRSSVEVVTLLEGEHTICDRSQLLIMFGPMIQVTMFVVTVN